MRDRIVDFVGGVAREIPAEFGGGRVDVALGGGGVVDSYATS